MKCILKLIEQPMKGFYKIDRKVIKLGSKLVSILIKS